MASPDLLGVVLDLLADKLAARIGVVRERDVYTSEDLPPDCRTRRAFAEKCRRIPEAEKRGRTWVVVRAAWEAHRRTRRGAAIATVAMTTAPPLTAKADALLARAGLRAVVGSR